MLPYYLAQSDIGGLRVFAIKWNAKNRNERSRGQYMSLLLGSMPLIIKVVRRQRAAYVLTMSTLSETQEELLQRLKEIHARSETALAISRLLAEEVESHKLKITK
ncbi:MAG: hypothetical protein ABJC04_06955, partial [Verrucomicrobiota bacterium]